jgi:hypothetical protein
MKLALGILAGLLWGAAAGFLNTRITNWSLSKGNTNQLLAGNLLRMVVDLAALGLVFLLRHVLPLPFEALLIGTAISLSLVTILYAFRYGKK